MKYLIAFLLLLPAPVLIAQKKFEGSIRYLMVSADSSIVLSITAYYKKTKIRFVTEIGKAPAGAGLKSETILLDFKKPAIERLKDKEKTVEREWMTGKGKKQDLPSLTASGTMKTILGHPCREYTSGRFLKSEQKDSATVATAGEIRFWYADDLLFPVPDSLKMIQMVPLFTNGHIALGSEIQIQQAGISLILHTEAKEIHAQRLKRLLFRYPKDYRLRNNG
jgi:hypothetical protein